MRKLIPTFLAVAASAGALYAQGEVKPAELGPWTVAAAFDPANQPYTDAQQIHIVKLPGMAAKDWYVGLTVGGLSPTYGGAGGSDVLTGLYDSLADVFTPNFDCLILNSSSGDFGFSIHHSGRYAVWDRLSAGIALTSWDSANSRWGAPVTVQNVATESYYDPCLADIRLSGGSVETWLFWHSLDDIVGAKIDLANGAVTGAPIPVILHAQTGSTANSPTPILTSAGEILGFSHHDVLNAAGDDDHYFSFDLDPNTPSLGPWFDTTTWINNGGIAGGTFFDCHWDPAPHRIWRAETYWLAGGRASAASTMEISAFVPLNHPNPTVSVLMLAPFYASPPLPLAGITNDLGIILPPIVVAALGNHDLVTGRASVSFPVPPTPPITIPVQSFSFDSVTLQITLSNTAALTIL